MSVGGFVPEGEELQTVFTARAGHTPDRLHWSALAVVVFPPLLLVGLIMMLVRRQNRVVAVTDGQIRVFSASPFSPCRPRSEVTVEARETPLVPHREKHWSSIELGDEMIWVHNESLSRICQANNLR